jgi:hypothetical protein
MLSEELVQSHLEIKRNAIDPHQDDAHWKVFFPHILILVSRDQFGCRFATIQYTEMVWLEAVAEF